MGQHAPKTMTVDDYYAWAERQEDRYEFVNGTPVRMMSGANRRHDQIVYNTLLALGTGLRGSACRGFTADTAVATGPSRRRRPDVGVECGERRDGDYVANEPRVVVEVLSPSTREFDLFGKLDEYRSVPSMQNVLVIEPNVPDVMLWSRQADGGWSNERVQGLDRDVEIGSIGVAIPMREIYDGLDIRPRPELVSS